MANAPRPWTVLPHRPIEHHEENLWSVDGSLDYGHMRRRMAIVKLGDGRLVLHNAVPLTDEAMHQIEAWGQPAILVVTNGLHRLDVHAFKARYPELTVLCPAAADARVRLAVDVSGHYDALPADPALRVEALDGLKNGEGVFVVTRGARKTLLFADALFNLPHLPGLDGWLFRLLGSTGGVKVTWIGRQLIVSDKAALAAHYRRLAQLDGLHRLVFTHGDTVEGNAAAVLEQVATTL